MPRWYRPRWQGKTAPLTDTAVRTAKPRCTAYKPSDARGLQLRVTPHGSKPWRWATPSMYRWRSRILHAAPNLEERGIIGEGLSFTSRAGAALHAEQHGQDAKASFSYEVPHEDMKEYRWITH